MTVVMALSIDVYSETLKTGRLVILLSLTV